MQPLITARELLGMLGEDKLVVIDCTNSAALDEEGKWRTVADREGYEAGHIPGAGYADFTEGLAGYAKFYRNTLPSPAAFAHGMEQLGLWDGMRVVLYDRGQSMWAARVWWMLHWIGFKGGMVLDGGLEGWKAAGGEVETGPAPEIPPGRLSLEVQDGMFVDKTGFLDHLQSGGPVIDALSRAQFNGEEERLGLKGHVLGARNVPADELVGEDGHFLDEASLRAQLPRWGTGSVVYCGSGIAAAAVAFNMVRLGLGWPAIYMPGLQEWLEDPKLATVTGNDGLMTRPT